MVPLPPRSEVSTCDGSGSPERTSSQEGICSPSISFLPSPGPSTPDPLLSPAPFLCLLLSTFLFSPPVQSPGFCLCFHCVVFIVIAESEYKLLYLGEKEAFWSSGSKTCSLTRNPLMGTMPHNSLLLRFCRGSRAYFAALYMLDQTGHARTQSVQWQEVRGRLQVRRSGAFQVGKSCREDAEVYLKKLRDVLCIYLLGGSSDDRGPPAACCPRKAGDGSFPKLLPPQGSAHPHFLPAVQAGFG